MAHANNHNETHEHYTTTTGAFTFADDDGTSVTLSYELLCPRVSSSLSRPPAVFISGLAHDRHSLREQAIAVAKHTRALVFDNRGIGSSTIGPSSDAAFTIPPFSIAALAVDVRRLLQHVFPSENKFIIVGCSMGCYISQHFLLLYPSLVYCAILGCGTSDRRGVVRPRYERPEAPKDDSREEMEKYKERVQAMQEHVNEKNFPADWIAAHRSEFSSYVSSSQLIVTQPGAVARQTAACDGHHIDLQAFKEATQNIPIMFVHGTDDRVVAFDQGERLAATAGPLSSFVRLPATGHLLWVQHRELFSNMCAEFVEKQLEKLM